MRLKERETEMKRLWIIVIVIALIFGLSACGGGNNASAQSSSASSSIAEQTDGSSTTAIAPTEPPKAAEPSASSVAPAPEATPATAPETTPATAEKQQVSPSTTDSTGTTGFQYIGNPKTKKFHLPTCSYLPAENNRVYFDTRQEAIDAGYSPCGHCKP